MTMAKATSKRAFPVSNSSRSGQDRKERLFRDFYRAASQTLSALELQFDVSGVCDQVFKGIPDDLSEGSREARMAHLRSNRAWSVLEALYDYAVDGLVDKEDPSDIVIGGSDVLWLATSENSSPSDEWREIVAMGDGRFALDQGDAVGLHKLALLANVDPRSVRNAISAGDLVAEKGDDSIYIENASARRWLLGRKGFKPTVAQRDNPLQELSAVTTPAALGAYLTVRRHQLGLTAEEGRALVLQRNLSASALEHLEAGAFILPLDAVFPIADFYQVGRKALLECVMRVFFAEELRVLQEGMTA